MAAAAAADNPGCVVLAVLSGSLPVKVASLAPASCGLMVPPMRNPAAQSVHLRTTHAEAFLCVTHKAGAKLPSVYLLLQHVCLLEVSNNSQVYSSVNTAASLYMRCTHQVHASSESMCTVAKYRTSRSGSTGLTESAF